MTNLVKKGGIRINTKFDQLKEDKQRRIIAAALQEFALNGYDKTSTNQIVLNAEISKGALFDYFGSKKGLYTYLLTYCLNIMKEMVSAIDLSERDIFTRITNVGIQKVVVYHAHPHVFDFLTSAQLESSTKVKDLMAKKIPEIYQIGLEKIYSDIDYSLFRSDVDVEKAIEILNWTMNGFSEKYSQQIDASDDSSPFIEVLSREWEVYADMLKKNFYH